MHVHVPLYLQFVCVVVFKSYSHLQIHLPHQLVNEVLLSSASTCSSIHVHVHIRVWYKKPYTIKYRQSAPTRVIIPPWIFTSETFGSSACAMQGATICHYHVSPPPQVDFIVLVLRKAGCSDGTLQYMKFQILNK